MLQLLSRLSFNVLRQSALIQFVLRPVDIRQPTRLCLKCSIGVYSKIILVMFADVFVHVELVEASSLRIYLVLLAAHFWE